jgi:molybdopterin molybdotransferase
MDGIAVPDVEPAVGTKWQLVGDALAGAKAAAALEFGEAIRIATGGVVPKGAGRVLPEEILQFSARSATLTTELGTARFIRRSGADFARGELLLERSVRIGPAEIGLIAAANYASVQVIREPRVGICTAGDELVQPGTALREGQSIDSATHALAALIRRWGGVPGVAPLLADDLTLIISRLTTAADDCDILVCIGGASVGARDLMRPAARAMGTEFLFEGIAVQPGKPCWCGRLKSGKLVLGVPGNPSSALVCAHLLLLPLIEKLMGRAPQQPLLPAFLTTELPANGAREQYLRAIASLDPEGRLLVTPFTDQDSGLQATLAKARFLIRQSAGAGPVERGAMVQALELTTI